MLASDAEKELVSEFLGGMPGACGSGDRLSAAKRVQQGSGTGKVYIEYMVKRQLLKDELGVKDRRKNIDLKLTGRE